MQVERSKDTVGTIYSAYHQRLCVPEYIFRCGSGGSYQMYSGHRAPSSGCAQMRMPNGEDYSDDLYRMDRFFGLEK